MSNHYSAANLRFPGDDARLDFTDLYVFPVPGDSGRTTLIMNANPYTTGISAMPPFLMKQEFHPDGVYRFNIDSDGDAQADAAFTFSEFRNGAQTGTAHYATGRDAQHPEPAGEVLISGTPVGFGAAAQPVQAGLVRPFFGVRSDPFFADADGSFHGFNWTGQDAFALEVPDDMLGPGPEIGVWATVNVRRDSGLVQVDRGGHPTINPFINSNDIKDTYNLGHPADDVASYLLVAGVIWSVLLAVVAARRSRSAARAYQVVRQAFGGTLLLGLEVLVAADLVRTVAVAPTLDNVLVLGLIVVIRTFLSFSLETEIEGVAPWRRGRKSGAALAVRPPATTATFTESEQSHGS
jgi:uncharacterized membrane protein